MSRLWPDRIRIGFAPERVELASFGLRGGSKPRRQTSITCERTAAAAAWEPPLEILAESLRAFASRGDRATVVLSNAFVRYLVIPWPSEVLSPRELGELAVMRSRATFGEAAADWTIRVCPGAYGQPSIACAVETALVSALRERLDELGLRLVSLQPLLMAAYNDIRRELGRSSIFVIIESGRLGVSLLAEGEWHYVASRRCAADASIAIEQELAALDMAGMPEQLDVLLVGEGAFWHANGTRPTRMLPASASGARSLALCGAG